MDWVILTLPWKSILRQLLAKSQDPACLIGVCLGVAGKAGDPCRLSDVTNPLAAGICYRVSPQPCKCCETHCRFLLYCGLSGCRRWAVRSSAAARLNSPVFASATPKAL